MELGPKLREYLYDPERYAVSFFHFPRVRLPVTGIIEGSKTAKIELGRVHKSSMNIGAIFLSSD